MIQFVKGEGKELSVIASEDCTPFEITYSVQGSSHLMQYCLSYWELPQLLFLNAAMRSFPH